MVTPACNPRAWGGSETGGRFNYQTTQVCIYSKTLSQKTKPKKFTFAVAIKLLLFFCSQKCYSSSAIKWESSLICFQSSYVAPSLVVVAVAVTAVAVAAAAMAEAVVELQTLEYSGRSARSRYLPSPPPLPPLRLQPCRSKSLLPHPGQPLFSSPDLSPSHSPSLQLSFSSRR